MKTFYEKDVKEAADLYWGTVTPFAGGKRE
jgi:hypothetical protein